MSTEITNLNGYPLKDETARKLAEAIVVPTNVSAFENDAGYLTKHQDISHKLDADMLPKAINTALVQAKASGEFDGEDGKTPIKGVDYWTEADQESIVQDVIAKGGLVKTNQGSANVGKILVVGADGNLTLTEMPESMNGVVVGNFDENGNIILTGELADGTYTFQYKNTDGTYADVGRLTVGNVEEYTNLLSAATDATGAVLNGVGYLENKRWSSSSTSFDTYKDEPDCTLVGMLPFKLGQTLRIKNVDTSWKSYTMFRGFDVNRNNIATGYASLTGYEEMIAATAVDTVNNMFTVTPISPIASAGLTDATRYIAFAVKATNGSENIIVTIDEEIPV